MCLFQYFPFLSNICTFGGRDGANGFMWEYSRRGGGGGVAKKEPLSKTGLYVLRQDHE